MNQPGLPAGLAQLLDTSDVTSNYPDIVFLAAFIPGMQDILGSSTKQLVKFRLLEPLTPVLFFSFLSQDDLVSKDEFGVLQVFGTEFIQLPCSKETILHLVDNFRINPVSSDNFNWKVFAAKACKSLIKERILELTHNGKFAIGDMVLNPLRSNCVGLFSMPQFKESYLPLLQKNFDALHSYLALSEISELLQLCLVCSNSDDTFLYDAFKFANLLRRLSKYSTLIDSKEIISLIDSLNELLEKLQLK